MRRRTDISTWPLIAAAGVVCAAVVVLIVVAAMWVFGWGAFARSTADYRGESEQIEQTKADGDYRVAAYDRFYDLCASIQADEQQIALLESELDTNPGQVRADQVAATIAAVQANRADSIAEYNADAAKTDTAGAFRADDLPYEIDVEGDTTCTAK